MSLVTSTLPLLGRAGLPPVYRAAAPASRLGAVDVALVVLLLLGLYTSYTVMIARNVPFPSVPAGVAGMILLWRRRDRLTRTALIAMLSVLTVYAVSVIVAPDLSFLPRRLNGLVQITYSLVIGYALFLTITLGSREQIATLFLACALVLLVGCLLETYGGLRPLSDGVRKLLYARGLYEGDQRDILYYEQVRPKFFASEPSSVTFCYTLFAFVWLAVSRWRWKVPAYLGLVGLGIFAMPGPTLLLMLVLLAPYLVLLAPRRRGRLDPVRLVPMLLVAALSAGSFFLVAEAAFPQRHQDARRGDDPSSFYRVRGPLMAAAEIVTVHPITGAGLTGEPFIERRVTDLYLRSPHYSAAWPVVHPSSELLINYFWLHWVYLGLFFGVLAAVALTGWLLAAGVPSVAFTWTVWAIMGQAAGAYVGPTCWSVFFLAAACAVLHQDDAAYR
ncbi:MAG: hypothetical protein IBJ17_13170 [Reyranella sp.]|nr:hypothetical protein [Reyranella sp.]